LISERSIPPYLADFQPSSAMKKERKKDQKKRKEKKRKKY